MQVSDLWYFTNLKLSLTNQMVRGRNSRTNLADYMLESMKIQGLIHVLKKIHYPLTYKNEQKG